MIMKVFNNFKFRYIYLFFSIRFNFSTKYLKSINCTKCVDLDITEKSKKNSPYGNKNDNYNNLISSKNRSDKINNFEKISLFENCEIKQPIFSEEISLNKDIKKVVSLTSYEIVEKKVSFNKERFSPKTIDLTSNNFEKNIIFARNNRLYNFNFDKIKRNEIDTNILKNLDEIFNYFCNVEFYLFDISRFYIYKFGDEFIFKIFYGEKIYFITAVQICSIGSFEFIGRFYNENMDLHGIICYFSLKKDWSDIETFKIRLNVKTYVESCSFDEKSSYIQLRYISKMYAPEIYMMHINIKIEHSENNYYIGKLFNLNGFSMDVMAKVRKINIINN